jgi:hypothetical protein
LAWRVQLACQLALVADGRLAAGTRLLKARLLSGWDPPFKDAIKPAPEWLELAENCDCKYSFNATDDTKAALT